MLDPTLKQIMLMDMEICGIGSGPIDLCTFLLWRSPVEWRRKFEKQLVELYYETLIDYGQKKGTLTRESYTLEQCWNQYKFDGAAHLICYLTSIGLFFPQHVMQATHDTMKAFFEDHLITTENIPPVYP